MKDLEQVFIALQDVMDNRYKALQLSFSRNYKEHNDKKETEKMYPIFIAVQELDEFIYENIVLNKFGNPIEMNIRIRKKLNDYEYNTSLLLLLQLAKATGILIKVVNDKNQWKEILK